MENDLLSVFNNQIQLVNNTELIKQQIKQRSHETDVKCLELMCEKLSSLRSVGFSFNTSFKDSCGYYTPKVNIFYKGQYVCFVETPKEQITDELSRKSSWSSVRLAENQVGFNDLHRFGMPCGCVSYNYLTCCLATIIQRFSLQ